MMLLCVYFHQVHVRLAFLTEEGDVVKFLLFTAGIGDLRPREPLVFWKLVVAEVAQQMLGGHVS